MNAIANAEANDNGGDCQTCGGVCAADYDENYDHDDNDDEDDNVDSSLCGQRRGEYVGNLGIHTCLSITFTFFNFASDFNFLSACPSLSLSVTLPLTLTFFNLSITFTFFNFASDFNFLSKCPSLSLSLNLPLTLTFFQPVHHFHFL